MVEAGDSKEDNHDRAIESDANGRVRGGSFKDHQDESSDSETGADAMRNRADDFFALCISRD